MYLGTVLNLVRPKFNCRTGTKFSTAAVHLSTVLVGSPYQELYQVPKFRLFAPDDNDQATIFFLCLFVSHNISRTNITILTIYTVPVQTYPAVIRSERTYLSPFTKDIRVRVTYALQAFFADQKVLFIRIKSNFEYVV